MVMAAATFFCRLAWHLTTPAAADTLNTTREFSFGGIQKSCFLWEIREGTNSGNRV
jgi:hypothetical protein